MLSNLMRSKESHYVDYLNANVMGTGRAFGIYVRGETENNQAYSTEAKHRLYTSLDYVRRYLNEKEVAAIYVDVFSKENLAVKAFRKLVQDIKKGKFTKVLFADLEEIMSDESMAVELLDLSKERDDLEIIDLNGNIFQAKSVPVNHLFGV